MEVYCRDCDKLVSLQYEDEGIGPYEYWGAPGNDVQMVYSCAECGSTDLYRDEPERDGDEVIYGRELEQGDLAEMCLSD